MNKRTSIWITGDQCSITNSALQNADKKDGVVLMIESVERGSILKYHKKKLVLIYSVMRHFARELREAGWTVDYYQEQNNFREALDKHISKYQPGSFQIMAQSEYGANQKLKELLRPHEVKFYPHCNFISSSEEFERMHSSPTARVTMERFYRLMRKKTSLLMNGAEPAGGEWNYDKNNRQPPGKKMNFKPLPAFPADKITAEVIDMVERCFPDHPGTTNNWNYAVTRKDALLAAADFFDNKLDQFGPQQDAMLFGEPFLNHSVLSPYINVCLLHPLELCREAEHRYLSGAASLNSVEGFIRQLIGWREFIWQVYWRMMPEYKTRNALGASRPLPRFFWTGKTEMRCLSDSINTTIEHGYAHHIVRLMLLGNFALIAGLDPLETNDWFSSMFVDAYDWVMVPNVIGMTLHADGGYVGTKPYAASANYINKMSDFCKGCSYDPRKTFGEDACPFNALYWNFLKVHDREFSKNQRMSMIMKNLHEKNSDWKQQLQDQMEILEKTVFDVPD